MASFQPAFYESKGVRKLVDLVDLEDHPPDLSSGNGAHICQAAAPVYRSCCSCGFWWFQGAMLTVILSELHAVRVQFPVFFKFK
eukprot:s1688_g15.t1